MVYTRDLGALLAAQLERLATSNAHQLAGQFANLSFWLAETEHVLATIDDYPLRFRRLRDAQVAWVTAHGTMTLGPCAQCGGGRCELGSSTPPPPTRTSSADMDRARAAVHRGCYRLLIRYHRLALLDEAALQAGCDRIGVTLEREDLA